MTHSSVPFSLEAEVPHMARAAALALGFAVQK